MPDSLAFIESRATKTLSVAQQLASTWTWQEQTPAQFAALITPIIGDRDAVPPVVGLKEIAAKTEATMLAARGAWDKALDQLHRWTQQDVALAKNRFRDDPAKSAQVAPLQARGDSRRIILEDALAWESAWSVVDPTWLPLPASTFAAFKALRLLANEDLKTAYTDAQTRDREAGAKLTTAADHLNNQCIAWYADATRVFAAGTAEGTLVRTIPTTYSPPPKPAAPAVP